LSEQTLCHKTHPIQPPSPHYQKREGISYDYMGEREKSVFMLYTTKPIKLKDRFMKSFYVTKPSVTNNRDVGTNIALNGK
jgi:hypothetical protein